jgi:hypothetical protein
MPIFERMYGSLLNPDTEMQEAAPKLSPMAHLTLISTIWGDVFSTTSRAVHRGGCPSYYSKYEIFYQTTARRLATWSERLPSHLRYSTRNLDESIRHGYAGTFISLHALYHTASIRLNRHVRISRLTTGDVISNITRAIDHAHSILEMMRDISKKNRKARFGGEEAVGSDFVFSTPFPGYAFINAVDVLSACGVLSSVPQLVENIATGLRCVEELAEFWASAKAQLKACRQRLKQLGDIAMSQLEGATESGQSPHYTIKFVQIAGDSDGNGRAGLWQKIWRMNTALETGFDKADDLLYGTDLDMSLAAFKDVNRSPADRDK